MGGHVKTDSGFKAFRPTFVNELIDNDLQSRQDSCGRILEVFTTITKCTDVIFTGKCVTYHSSRSRNIHFWSKEKRHFHEEKEHNLSHVMIRASISARCIFGPYFFESSVNLHTYLTTLTDWLVLQL